MERNFIQYFFRLSTELCPADFVSAGNLGSCYHVSSRNLTHFDAREACEKMHPKARRVSIETINEHNLLRYYLEQLYLQHGMFFTN